MIQNFEDKFRKVISQMEKAGKEYAEIKGQSWQSQNLKASVLSNIMNKLEGSIAERERIALASQEYQDFIKSTAELIKHELISKCTYEKWQASFEALRSLSSLEKKILNQTE